MLLIHYLYKHILQQRPSCLRDA